MFKRPFTISKCRYIKLQFINVKHTVSIDRSLSFIQLCKYTFKVLNLEVFDH